MHNRSLFSEAWDDVRSWLGSTAPLRRYLESVEPVSWQLDATPARSIYSNDVIGWTFWHSGHHAHQIRYFLRTPYRFELSYIDTPALREMVTQQKLEGWACEISDIEGLSASKSNLSNYSSIDHFVTTASPEMISDISPEGLQANLQHSEIRILNEHWNSDHINRYLWDGGRIYLVNSGGSHHFAAARYQARKLQTPIPLRANLYTYSLNRKAINALLTDYVVLSAPRDFADYDFRKLMESFGVSYGLYPLPIPYNDGEMLLLPRREKRAMTVAQLLIAAGVYDISRYFHAVLQRQVALSRCAEQAQT